MSPELHLCITEEKQKFQYMQQNCHLLCSINSQLCKPKMYVEEVSTEQHLIYIKVVISSEGTDVIIHLLCDSALFEAGINVAYDVPIRLIITLMPFRIEVIVNLKHYYRH